MLLNCSKGALESSFSVLEEFICAVFSNVSGEIKCLSRIYLQDTCRFHEDIFGVTLRTYEVQDRARRQVWKDVYKITHVINILKDHRSTL